MDFWDDFSDNFRVIFKCIEFGPCFTKESPVFSLVMVLEVVQDFSASMLSNFPVASTALTPKVYVTPASSSFKVRLVPVVVLVYTATKQQCEREERDTILI